VVVSHDIPLASRIAEASPDTPYLAVILRLDRAILRSVITDLSETDDGETSASIQVGTADQELLGAMDRLLKLNNKQDAAVLAPLITREIHYRLVNAEHGAVLRHLARHTGASAAITTSIARIRGDLAEPLSIPELAQGANMGQSTFHHHFKAITETTPLQYQKQLRLLEARRLLVEEDQSVHQSARSVGYHSATQFSREYSRAFGAPPRDAKHGTTLQAPAN
jgi:transcriptional regulator GlxA family with amidase domain